MASVWHLECVLPGEQGRPVDPDGELNGVPLATVRTWAGHSSLAVTSRYTHVSESEDAATLELVYGRAGVTRGSQEPRSSDLGFRCAPETIRTSDTRFRRAVLYPLSYEGNRKSHAALFRALPL